MFRTHKEIGERHRVTSTPCTRYRAELLAILATLYTLKDIEQRTNGLHGSVVIESSHKRALREAFRHNPLGVKTAVQTNYDLIMEIRHLSTTLTIKIYPSHTPVHAPNIPSIPTDNNARQVQREPMSIVQPDVASHQPILPLKE